MKITGTLGTDILKDTDRRDLLTGKDGADHFIFERDGRTDRIADFQINLDKIDLSHYNVGHDEIEIRLNKAGEFTIKIRSELLKVKLQDAPNIPRAELYDLLDEDQFIFASNPITNDPISVIDFTESGRLYGSSGVDYFIIDNDHDRDVVLYFEDNKDKIDLSEFNTSYAQLDFVDRFDGKVLIKLGNQGLVIRDGSKLLTSDDFTADDFIF